MKYIPVFHPSGGRLAVKCIPDGFVTKDFIKKQCVPCAPYVTSNGHSSWHNRAGLSLELFYNRGRLIDDIQLIYLRYRITAEQKLLCFQFSFDRITSLMHFINILRPQYLEITF